MTQLRALIVACALLFTDTAGLLGDENYDLEFTGPALLYLISTAIFIAHIELFPKNFITRHYYMCVLIEAALALIILEISLHYIWNFIEKFVSRNADDVIVSISKHDWLQSCICHFCCGKDNCTQKFSRVALKLLSVGILVFAASIP